MTKKKPGIYFFLLVLVVLAVPAGAKPLSLFDTDEVFEMTVTTDLKTLRKDIKKERSYHPGRLSYLDSQNREISLNIQIRTRGHSRRNPRACDFPPLRIKFLESEARDTIFREQAKLKLVTHCQTKIKAFQGYVLQEYLCYKLYNILTDKSFRVRLARVTYVDSQGKSKPYSSYAFFIENEKKMAQRIRGKIIQNTGGLRILSKMKNRVLHAVFQFMIGNTDFSAPFEHNVKIVASDYEDVFFPVPYDFDLAGIIETHYAKPDPKLRHKIKSVRERLYRGFCGSETQLNFAFAHFNKNKEKIYALYTNFPLLKSKVKKRIIRYLDEFYKIIDNPRLVKRYFLENCR
jgi:hypothetical protein